MPVKYKINFTADKGILYGPSNRYGIKNMNWIHGLDSWTELVIF